MDRICGAVLNKIFALSPAGRYVIIDEDEFFDAFPDDCEKSFEELKRSLTLLCKGGYIDVKYSRGETYCVAPLKRYEAEPELEPDIQKPKFKLDPVLISAFAGSVLGSLIVLIISEIIRYAF